MIFRETRLRGAYVIDIERNADERGLYAPTWCRRDLAARNLQAE
jgi:dTDP-4-dehydrorhamnose 3,5-epimerase